MKKGIKNSIQISVTNENTAKSVGSGILSVFATPAMIALIEETAWKSVTPFLEEGFTTVGTLLNVKHLSPTPLNMSVRCETELVEIDGRRLKFEANVYDDTGLIGTGIHERFIVNADKFQIKADEKRNQ